MPASYGLLFLREPTRLCTSLQAQHLRSALRRRPLPGPSGGARPPPPPLPAALRSPRQKTHHAAGFRSAPGQQETPVLARESHSPTPLRLSRAARSHPASFSRRFARRRTSFTSPTACSARPSPPSSGRHAIAHPTSSRPNPSLPSLSFLTLPQHVSLLGTGPGIPRGQPRRGRYSRSQPLPQVSGTGRPR